MDNKTENEDRLDIETLTGLSLTDPRKPLKLYWNRERSMKTASESNLWLLILVMLPSCFLFLLYNALILIFGDIAIHFQSMFTFAAIVLTAVTIFFCIYFGITSTKDINRSIKPVIEVDSDGISIHCSGRNFEKIPWECIKEVITQKTLGWRSIIFIPNDGFSFFQFSSEDKIEKVRTFLKKEIFANYYSLLPSYSYIDIPERFLPLDAEEITDLINIRLRHYRRIENRTR